MPYPAKGMWSRTRQGVQRLGGAASELRRSDLLFGHAASGADVKRLLSLLVHSLPSRSASALASAPGVMLNKVSMSEVALPSSSAMSSSSSTLRDVGSRLMSTSAREDMNQNGGMYDASGEYDDYEGHQRHMDGGNSLHVGKYPLDPSLMDMDSIDPSTIPLNEILLARQKLISPIMIPSSSEVLPSRAFSPIAVPSENGSGELVRIPFSTLTPSNSTDYLAPESPITSPEALCAVCFPNAQPQPLPQSQSASSSSSSGPASLSHSQQFFPFGIVPPVTGMLGQRVLTVSLEDLPVSPGCEDLAHAYKIVQGARLLFHSGHRSTCNEAYLMKNYVRLLRILCHAHEGPAVVYSILSAVQEDNIPFSKDFLKFLIVCFGEANELDAVFALFDLVMRIETAAAAAFSPLLSRVALDALPSADDQFAQRVLSVLAKFGLSTESESALRVLQARGHERTPELDETALVAAVAAGDVNQTKLLLVSLTRTGNALPPACIRKVLTAIGALLGKQHISFIDNVDKVLSNTSSSSSSSSTSTFVLPSSRLPVPLAILSEVLGAVVEQGAVLHVYELNLILAILVKAGCPHDAVALLHHMTMQGLATLPWTQKNVPGDTAARAKLHAMYQQASQSSTATIFEHYLTSVLQPPSTAPNPAASFVPAKAFAFDLWACDAPINIHHISLDIIAASLLPSSAISTAPNSSNFAVKTASANTILQATAAPSAPSTFKGPSAEYLTMSPSRATSPPPPAYLNPAVPFVVPPFTSVHSKHARSASGVPDDDITPVPIKTQPAPSPPPSFYPSAITPVPVSSSSSSPSSSSSRGGSSSSSSRPAPIPLVFAWHSVAMSPADVTSVSTVLSCRTNRPWESTAVLGLYLLLQRAFSSTQHAPVAAAVGAAEASPSSSQSMPRAAPQEDLDDPELDVIPTYTSKPSSRSSSSRASYSSATSTSTSAGGGVGEYDYSSGQPRSFLSDTLLLPSTVNSFLRGLTLSAGHVNAATFAVFYEAVRGFLPRTDMPPPEYQEEPFVSTDLALAQVSSIATMIEPPRLAKITMGDLRSIAHIAAWIRLSRGLLAVMDSEAVRCSPDNTTFTTLSQLLQSAGSLHRQSPTSLLLFAPFVYERHRRRVAVDAAFRSPQQFFAHHHHQQQLQQGGAPGNRGTRFANDSGPSSTASGLFDRPPTTLPNAVKAVNEVISAIGIDRVDKYFAGLHVIDPATHLLRPYATISSKNVDVSKVTLEYREGLLNNSNAPAPNMIRVRNPQNPTLPRTLSEEISSILRVLRGPLYLAPTQEGVRQMIVDPLGTLDTEARKALEESRVKRRTARTVAGSVDESSIPSMSGYGEAEDRDRVMLLNQYVRACAMYGDAEAIAAAHIEAMMNDLRYNRWKYHPLATAYSLKNALLCLNDLQRPDLAVRVVELAEFFEFPLATDNYNTVIHSVAQAPPHTILATLIKLLEGMAARNVVPSAVTFNALLHVLAWHGLVHEVLEIYVMMLRGRGTSAPIRHGFKRSHTTLPSIVASASSASSSSPSSSPSPSRKPTSSESPVERMLVALDTYPDAAKWLQARARPALASSAVAAAAASSPAPAGVDKLRALADALPYKSEFGSQPWTWSPLKRTILRAFNSVPVADSYSLSSMISACSYSIPPRLDLAETVLEATALGNKVKGGRVAKAYVSGCLVQAAPKGSSPLSGACTIPSSPSMTAPPPPPPSAVYLDSVKSSFGALELQDEWLARSLLKGPAATAHVLSSVHSAAVAVVSARTDGAKPAGASSSSSTSSPSASSSSGIPEIPVEYIPNINIVPTQMNMLAFYRLFRWSSRPVPMWVRQSAQTAPREASDMAPYVPRPKMAELSAVIDKMRRW